MTHALAVAPAPLVSNTHAREELVKFFQIAEVAATAPEMFSAFIDAEWHRLLDNEAEYRTLCLESVGHMVGHVQEEGHGQVTWVELYHERFGTLPTSWFADERGTVDEAAYRSYLDTKKAGGTFQCQTAPPPCQPDMSIVG